MVNYVRADLYQRLQDFELDDPTHEFGFTRHLMKNEGWTLIEAQRAIVEYKKFAFLTVVANHQVVPSDRVDRVWHAHVLLTQSYWEEFCPKVLGQPLHHHPARGGRAERTEFHRLYAETIASYRHFFGSPPIDIWSPPERRFGAELKMQRVNLSENWVIPKRLTQSTAIASVVAIAIMALICLGCVDVAWGSTLSGFGTNLTIDRFTAIMIGMPIIVGAILRYVIGLPTKQPYQPQLDIYQMAYLAGGSQRAVELAITRLVDRGYLRPNVRHRTFTIDRRLNPEATYLEEQVLQQVTKTPDFKSLCGANYQTDFLNKVLQQEKLLMSGWALTIGNLLAIWIAIICLGGIILVPISILSQLLLGIQVGQILYDITAIPSVVVSIVAICCFVPSGRTHWGRRVLISIKKNHDVYDVNQRFALYGYQVLSGGNLDALKQIFKVQAEADAGGCGCGC